MPDPDIGDPSRRPRQRIWWNVLGRSLIAGVLSGTGAAWALFFLFGAIGLTGGDLVERVRNGWRAAEFLGTRRGVTVGAEIAVVLTASTLLWYAVRGSLRPATARPWLAIAAGLMVVVGNVVAGPMGMWDPIGILTVSGMAMLAAAVVWIVSPWVLAPFESGRR